MAQADGKILVGGDFNVGSIGGQTRNHGNGAQCFSDCNPTAHLNIQRSANTNVVLSSKTCENHAEIYDAASG